MFILNIINCDSEVTGERGPGLCPEPLFFLLCKLLWLKISSGSPSCSKEATKKALTCSIGPQQDQASFSSQLSCHHYSFWSFCSSHYGTQTDSYLTTLALDTCLESSFPDMHMVPPCLLSSLCSESISVGPWYIEL